MSLAHLLLPAGMALAQAPVRPATNDSPQPNGVEDSNWSLHTQLSYYLQGYPGFGADYSGPASLRTAEQWRHLATHTVFIGRRLWEGAEAFINPESYYGYGINETTGMAGFPNGEAAKAGTNYVRPTVARYFLRQTFGLGGGSETVADDQNQIAGRQDKSRIVLTVGKISLPDILDDNTYSHDPRLQFMNWALMSSGAYDFAANARGYTRAAAAELYQPGWAIRYVAALPPQQVNGNDLPFRGFKSLSHNLEYERSHEIFDRPGRVRLLGFVTAARMARFSTALAANSPDINLAMEADRQYGHLKYGAALSGEQELTDDLGAFLRLSWNDGQTEDWAFTQIDRSIGTGIRIKGLSWGRPDDVIGLGGAVNTISADHRSYLARGGRGLIIGDGRLDYSPEVIAESYYSAQISKSIALTFDYQFVANPAYNNARGPVNIFALRAHFEY